MKKIALALAVACLTGALARAEGTLPTWKKIKVSDQFYSEGAAIGDFNKDGKMDIVSGPFWYEGPEFKTRHEYYPANASFKRKGKDGKEETSAGFEGAGKCDRIAFVDVLIRAGVDSRSDGVDQDCK